VAVRSLLATPKAEETRQRILDAALELFREKGFERTTMRDVAAAAGVATGAAYYYFRSKDDLVLAFYVATAEEMREVLPPKLAETRDLKKRIRLVIDLKFSQFAGHRKFLGALMRSAVDPVSPLSPFSDETQALRDEAIDWFRRAIDESGEKIPPDVRPILPTLLWLYQMGVISYWLYDRSPKQKRTTRLVDGTLDLIVKMIRICRLPLMGGLRRSVVKLLEELDVVDEV
jgi:AcrR family transcriptional regulator